jgi:antitoxin component of RelBE/YafQ-DinJ toxin-antitoxin module
MKADSHIQIRIDEDSKKKAQELFKKQGMSLSKGIKFLLNNFINKENKTKSNIVITNSLNSVVNKKSETTKKSPKFMNRNEKEIEEIPEKIIEKDIVKKEEEPIKDKVIKKIPIFKKEIEKKAEEKMVKSPQENVVKTSSRISRWNMLDN